MLRTRVVSAALALAATLWAAPLAMFPSLRWVPFGAKPAQAAIAAAKFSLASTKLNATQSIRTGNSTLWGYSINPGPGTTGAAGGFLQIFTGSTTPTLGTTIPNLQFPFAASGSVQTFNPPIPIAGPCTFGLTTFAEGSATISESVTFLVQ